MPDLKNRLTKKDISLKEMLVISYDYYHKNDNKEWRAKLDIKQAKLTRRQNFSYNKSKRQWEQTGRETKFSFLIKSDPISYKRTDKLKYHWYPVIFILRDVSMGINSPMKWRTGSLIKPQFTKKGMTKKQREKITERNIKQGIQLQFFFELEWVLHQYNLLYGRNWATYPPRKTNSTLFPFFDKHAFYIASKILLPLLGSTKRFALNKIWKNE
jgi:hypothetical protein